MKKDLVVITGLSGAGKKNALNFFEDYGYFCTDNLPALLLNNFLEIIEEKNISKTAVSVDIRSQNLFADLKGILSNLLSNDNFNVKIIYLECNEQVLVNRYKETRKNHPLSNENNLLDGIREERNIMNDIKGIVNYIYDTSDLTVKQLIEKLSEDFDKEKKEKYHIVISSFGYKYGIPIDADDIIDVRFLTNPFYIHNLREKTGLDDEVYNYIFSDEITKNFYKLLKQLLFFMVDKYQYEGRDKVSIAIGCTGGKHRSVSIARKLYKDISELGYRTYIDHRDIDKGK